jgi:HNH endonuclease
MSAESMAARESTMQAYRAAEIAGDKAAMWSATQDMAGLLGAGLGVVGKAGTSGGLRAGKEFTRAGKREVIEGNRTLNDGKTICALCGAETVPGTQSQKSVTPSRNETNVDHIHPKSRGGDGAASNGQVACRGCNLAKSNKLPGE